MDPDRFRDSPAGRLVRARRDGADYWAFMPHSLPPGLAGDHGLSYLLAAASGALGELRGLGRMLPNPRLLIDPFIRREAVLSSRIEGTRTTIAELYAYQVRQFPLPGMRSTRASEDAREVANYVAALEYGLHRLDSLPVSLRFIRELHGRLMEGVRGGHATPGEFRRSQNWIGNAQAVLSDATYVPPPPPEMHEALDAFEQYLHAENTYHPLIRLAFIHYQFEAIHPFLDGNGRIGRLLVVILLVHWDLLPAPLLYLSAFLEQQRSTYYELLLAVSERGTWHEWVTFFLHGVLEQAQDAVDRARSLLDLLRDWRERVSRLPRAGQAPRLLEDLFISPFVSVPTVQHLLGDVSYHTALRAVERLVEADILRRADTGDWGRVWVADAILEILAAPVRAP